MSSKLPYFRWHPKDFDTDENVRLMSMCEVGLYVLCLNHSWINGSIPDDVVKIAKIVSQPLREVKRCWAKIKPCFVLDVSGNLINPKQEKERQWAAERSAKSPKSSALRGQVLTTAEVFPVGEIKENHDAYTYGSDSVSGSGSKTQEENSAHAFIDFETFMHRWKQHRGLKKPQANIRERAEFRWGTANFQITEEQIAVALDGFCESDWAKREGFPMLGFLRNPMSWSERKSTAVTGSAWTENPGLVRLKEAFDLIGAPTIAADWEDTPEIWKSFTNEEQEKAISRVPEYDGAFMKRPVNYLRKREFDRPPRPVPKSDLERLMDTV